MIYSSSCGVPATANNQGSCKQWTDKDYAAVQRTTQGQPLGS